ncbi:MAG: hypothetical protein HY852_13170 [Bradyrhizobium sp.]|uniref:hypothetical protein n=1 Tax=Bradyrhizobium sp. TaxID=376 RepID=UPI0025B886B7|nr:hypothetical protein [Bradyrhizobium sp.]MBI5262756.1 hypothetical protein [Bradyrhizobium sp.]
MPAVAPKKRFAILLALVPVCSAVLVFTYAYLRGPPPVEMSTLRQAPAGVPDAGSASTPSPVR